MVPSSRKVHHHRTPSVPWQLPAVAAQKVAWLCARLAYASSSQSSTSAAAAAGKDKAALQALLPHAVALCEQAKAYYSSVKPLQQVWRSTQGQPANSTAAVASRLQFAAEWVAGLKEHLLVVQQSGVRVEQSTEAYVQQELAAIELKVQQLLPELLDADQVMVVAKQSTDIGYVQQLIDLVQLQHKVVAGKLATLQQLAASTAQEQQQQQAASTAQQAQQQASSTAQQAQQQATSPGQQPQQLIASTGQQQTQQQQGPHTAQQQPAAGSVQQQEQQAAGAGQQHQQQEGVVSMAAATGAEAASDGEPPAPLADDSDDDMPQLVEVVESVQTHATVIGQQQQQPAGDVSMAADTAAEAASAAESPAPLAQDSDEDMPQLIQVVESVQIHALTAVS